MLPWTRFERRWRDALLAAMIPAPGARGLPGLAELDLGAFWEVYRRRAPPLLRLGFRVAVWALTWLPLLTFRGARPLHRLSPERRDLVLEGAARSRSYLLRQLTLTVKVIACFAYFREPSVRRRFEGAA